MSLAPRTHVKVVYQGVDITRDVSTDLLSLNYVDAPGGEADDLSLSLKNDHGLWSGDWLPQKGDGLECTIITEDASGTRELPLGRVEIDELEASFYPSVLNIKAVSTPINTTARRKVKSRAWENVRLSEIAADIAKTAGLKLEYQPLANPPPDPFFDRRDQHDETDLQFLQRLCKTEGFDLKCSAAHMVVYDVGVLSVEPPAITYTRGQDDIITFNAKTQAHSVYKTAVVSYTDPDTGTTHTVEVTDPSVSVGQELKTTLRAKSAGEAERMGLAALKNANQFENTAELTVRGQVFLAAGLTISVQGFGQFSGNYFIQKATHTVSNGYTVALELTKAVAS